MQQKDILETFKKYVGEFGLSQKFQIPLCKTQRIQNFGEDIKSANELTGALQTLKITFKKILDIASMLGSDEVQDSLVAYQIQEKIAQCRFMGNDLFDAVLSAKIGNQQIVFENPSPMPLLDRGDLSGFVGYIQDKLGEITQTLGVLSEAICNEKLFGKQENVSNMDFEHFDPKAFKKMF